MSHSRRSKMSWPFYHEVSSAVGYQKPESRHSIFSATRYEDLLVKCLRLIFVSRAQKPGFKSVGQRLATSGSGCSIRQIVSDGLSSLTYLLATLLDLIFLAWLIYIYLPGIVEYRMKTQHPSANKPNSQTLPQLFLLLDH